ncbi:MAG: hypothetical protein GY849_02205 [Deltaproteobacteria bacterium]|nr:hypothetical protein [Deltaproteobacteria bacterium]
MKFREKIKTEALKQGFTVYKLVKEANKLSIDSKLQQNQLRRYLDGKTDLQGENIERLLKVLDIKLTCV